ncbi:MAG: CoA transferase, partial [Pseudomonadota bacterium]
MTDSTAASGKGALAGIRIVDLTDERAIYGAKLLADLGADVVRVEPHTGDPLRQRGPFAESESGSESHEQVSLWHAFFASNRRFFGLNTDDGEQVNQLHSLLQVADVLL